MKKLITEEYVEEKDYRISLSKRRDEE